LEMRKNSLDWMGGRGKGEMMLVGGAAPKAFGVRDGYPRRRKRRNDVDWRGGPERVRGALWLPSPGADGERAGPRNRPKTRRIEGCSWGGGFHDLDFVGGEAAEGIDVPAINGAHKTWFTRRREDTKDRGAKGKAEKLRTERLHAVVLRRSAGSRNQKEIGHKRTMRSQRSAKKGSCLPADGRRWTRIKYDYGQQDHWGQMLKR